MSDPGTPIDPSAAPAPVDPGQVPPPPAYPVYDAAPAPYAAPAWQPGTQPPAYPPAYAPAPASVPGVAPVAPRRSRAWIPWLIVGLVLLTLLGGCFFIPFAIFSSFDDVEGTTFGEGVAVIHIDGVIAGTGDAYSGYITPEYMLDQLDQAALDDSVKAVVLRVDSPGGTVAASEEIAALIKDYEKPVIVSVGDVGASGAYMISSQADQIWAMPGSAIGSIGVIAEIPNVEGLLDKLGVEFTVITAGEYKDAGSPYRPLTDAEKDLIQGEVDEAYGQFIDIVAEGRDIERSKVESMATGLTWSGEKAKEMGLIDHIGTYRDALDAAAEAGGIEGDYDIITYDEGGEFIDALLGISNSLGGIETMMRGGEALESRSLIR